MKIKRFKTVVLLFTVMICVVLGAAEKEILKLDFSNNDWPELLSERYGRYQVKNGIVEMEAGTVFRTALIPVGKGETLRVKFDAACEKLTGESYLIGWCTVSYFDSAKQPIGHVDTLQMRGDTAWHEVDRSIVPPGSCTYIRADFAHMGTGGKAFYKNISLMLRDNFTDELIGDSDFEDILGVNYWFFKDDGHDWDQLAFWQNSSRVEQDSEYKVSGDRSLKLTGGAATLVSKEFPYNGETLIFSGWMRAEKMKAGSKASWAGAGVQLVGLDENGNHIAHHDLNICVTDSPWTYYSNSNSFTGAVKRVQLMIRYFEGAQGTLWLDGVRFRRVPRGALMSFNGEFNRLELDATTPQNEPVNYRVWAGVDALFAAWMLQPYFQQYYPMLKKAGIEMIRFREIFNGLQMYPGNDANGEPVFNFEKWDQLMDLLTEEKFIPNITIGTTPPPLSKEGRANWCNPTAPVDMKRWGELVEATLIHSIERYGVEEVNRWYWEIWNEPVLPSSIGDYIGTVDEFVAMAREVYLAKERVDRKYGSNLRMGLTSGGATGASDNYLMADLAAMNKMNLVTHRSYHCYAGISNSILSIPAMVNDIKLLGKQLNSAEYEIGVTEWNCTAMSSVQCDTSWNAAMVVKMVRMYLDAGLDYSCFFALAGHPEIPQGVSPFREGGDLAMITRPYEAGHPEFGTLVALPKPVYHAFVLLNELKGGKRIPVKCSTEPVDAIAVRMADGNLRILLTNYDEDISRQPYTTDAVLNIRITPGAKYRAIRLLATDEIYGNCLTEWKKMGKPSLGNAAAMKQIVEASVPASLPCPEVIQENDRISVTIPVPSPGIRLLELKME